MFYFSVDSKELLDVDVKKLESGGIIQDFSFRDSILNNFEKNHSNYGHSSEDAIDYLNELDAFGYFRVEGVSPSSSEEACKIIHKHFFFPPKTIWIDGKIVFDDSCICG